MRGLKDGDKAILLRDIPSSGNVIVKGTIVTINSDDDRDCYLLKEYGGNFPCDCLEKYEGQPVKDTQPKFKVGDRVRVIHYEGVNKESVITGTKNIEGKEHYILKDFSCYYGPKELEIVTKPTPIPSSSKMLSNTIITDIKDEAQHKRVQEKLFSMGNYWIGEKVNTFYFPDKDDIKQIVLDDKGVMWIDCTIPGGGKHITANDFLQEVDEIQPFHFDRPLPDKIPTPSEDDDEEPSPYEMFTYIQNQVDKMLDKQPPQPKQRWCGKSILDLYNYKFPSEENKTNITSAKADVIKPMNNIVSFFNDLTVSAEDKELRKAGLKNSNLQWTNAAKEIVENLEAKELGLKNFEKLDEEFEFETDVELSTLEYKALFTKFYTKLLDTAKKYNRKDEKKAK